MVIVIMFANELARRIRAVPIKGDDETSRLRRYVGVILSDHLSMTCSGY